MGLRETLHRERTLGTGLDVRALDEIEPLAELAHHAPILLINKHDVSVPTLRARAHVTLARRVLLRVVLNHAALLRRDARVLQERRALRQDRLKGIDLLLAHVAVPAADGRELDAGERARLGPQVPARDQVAARRLVEDLRGGGQRQVELRRQVQVQVEVLLGRVRVVRGRGLRVEFVVVVVVGRGRGHHQQGERLRAVGVERVFVPVLQVVGVDAADAETGRGHRVGASWRGCWRVVVC